MDLMTEYMNRIRDIIAEIRAPLPSLPEPQRSLVEQHLAQMERIASEFAKK